MRKLPADVVSESYNDTMTSSNSQLRYRPEYTVSKTTTFTLLTVPQEDSSTIIYHSYTQIKKGMQ